MESSSSSLTRGSKRREKKAHMKCDCCRRKKIKCLPVVRDWSQNVKCDSCERSGHECGPNRRFNDPPPTPRPPSEAGLNHLAPATILSDNGLSQTASGNRDLDFSDNGQCIDGVTAGANSTLLSAQTIPASSAPFTSQPLLERTAENSNVSTKYGSGRQVDHRSSDLYQSCERLTRLGHLRILLENIRGLQRHIGPHLVTDEARDIKYNLKHMALSTAREYLNCLKDLVTRAAAAEEENLNTAKLTYLEVLEDVNNVGEEDGLSVADERAAILQRLIRIYQVQDNLPAVERMWKQLSDARYRLPEPANAETVTKLAHCSLEISAEVRKVFEDLKLPVEAPLYSSKSSPFPALHRALRGGDDEVSQVLCKTGVALIELDMLRQNAVIAAAATGKTALLEPILSSNTQLLNGRDVLDRTPLFHAAHNGDYASYLNLVRAGANVNDRDASGISILCGAVAQGSVEIVSDMLERGASPNPHDIGAPSPLYAAIKVGNQELCALLLAKGAWAGWRSPPDGKTLCQVARENNLNEIAFMLEKALPREEAGFLHSQPTQPTAEQQNHMSQMLSRGPGDNFGAFHYRAYAAVPIDSQGTAFFRQHTPSNSIPPHFDRQVDLAQQSPEPFVAGSPHWSSAQLASSLGTTPNSLVEEHGYGNEGVT